MCCITQGMNCTPNAPLVSVSLIQPELITMERCISITHSHSNNTAHPVLTQIIWTKSEVLVAMHWFLQVLLCEMLSGHSVYFWWLLYCTVHRPHTASCQGREGRWVGAAVLTPSSTPTMLGSIHSTLPPINVIFMLGLSVCALCEGNKGSGHQQIMCLLVNLSI